MRFPEGARCCASVPPPAPVPMMMTSNVCGWDMALTLENGEHLRTLAPHAQVSERRRALQGPIVAEVAQSRVVVRSTPLRRAEEAVGLQDGQVVDRGVASLHQPVLVELPVLVPVGAEPAATIVM